jgi:gustatory receptor
MQNFDQDTMTDLQLFSQQLLQRKMKFTAFGFLNLHYSLLFTIIGGVTTFLVIAVQEVQELRLSNCLLVPLQKINLFEVII